MAFLCTDYPIRGWGGVGGGEAIQWLSKHNFYRYCSFNHLWNGATVERIDCSDLDVGEVVVPAPLPPLLLQLRPSPLLLLLASLHLAEGQPIYFTVQKLSYIKYSILYIERSDFCRVFVPQSTYIYRVSQCSVCPLVGIGTLPSPLSPASVPLPPEPKGGGEHSPVGEGLG